MLEREREEIEKEVYEQFMKKISTMEVNILAYQDLLLTKDAELRTMEFKLNNTETLPSESALQGEINSLK